MLEVQIVPCNTEALEIKASASSGLSRGYMMLDLSTSAIHQVTKFIHCMWLAMHCMWLDETEPLSGSSVTSYLVGFDLQPLMVGTQLNDIIVNTT